MSCLHQTAGSLTPRKESLGSKRASQRMEKVTGADSTVQVFHSAMLLRCFSSVLKRNKMDTKELIFSFLFAQIGWACCWSEMDISQ